MVVRSSRINFVFNLLFFKKVQQGSKVVGRFSIFLYTIFLFEVIDYVYNSKTHKKRVTFK